jgi:hypothetical protein
LLLQAFVDLKPGARSIFTHFTFTFSRSSPARAVEETLGTSGNRTYSSCFSQDTLTTRAAILLKPPDIPVHADENGIESGKHRFLRISVGKELDPGSTGHGQQGIITFYDFVQLRKEISIALSLNGGFIRLKGGSILFEGILELFIQESDFPLTAGHADGRTAPTTHIQNLLEALDHILDFVKRFSLSNNHFFPPATLFLYMTSPAIPGTRLFLFFLVFCMTAYALFVESFFRIETGLRTMTGRTTDVLIPFLELTFIQNVFPIFIEVMTVLTGQSHLGMAVVRKRYGRPLFFSRCF